MSIFIFKKVGGSPFLPDFEFDAVLGEDREDDYKWTRFAVEDEGNISDHGAKEPKKFSASGVITATPFDALPGLAGRDRVSRTLDALVTLADELQIVTLVARWWVVDVVMLKVTSNSGEADGDMLNVTIRFQTVERPTAALVQIPKKGGSGVGKPVSAGSIGAGTATAWAGPDGIGGGKAPTGPILYSDFGNGLVSP